MALYGQCRAGAQINFPKSRRCLGHVTRTILAVRSAILATAWLLVLISSVMRKNEIRHLVPFFPFRVHKEKRKSFHVSFFVFLAEYGMRKTSGASRFSFFASPEIRNTTKWIVTYLVFLLTCVRPLPARFGQWPSPNIYISLNVDSV